jgi:hypothetical protein
MKRDDAPALDVRLHLNVTGPLNNAVAMAAHRKLVSTNAWCRQALLAALEKEGVELETRK